MSRTSGSGDDAAFCASLVREHDFSRYASTLFAAPGQRRALLALYAFNVEIVRVVDQVSQPLPGEIRLQWWTDLLEGLDHGGVEGHPVAAELSRAIRTHDLPTEPLLRLIEAHHVDLYNDPMPSMTTLEAYLNDTAGTLCASAARLLTPASEQVEHLAVHAGIAQGMARAIARLPVDAARQRAFVPADLLAQAGGNFAELYAGVATPALVAARGQMIAAGHAHLEQAMAVLPDVPVAARAAFLPLALVKRELDSLAGHDVFAMHEPPSHLRVLWTLWRASRSPIFS